MQYFLPNFMSEYDKHNKGNEMICQACAVGNLGKTRLKPLKF